MTQIQRASASDGASQKRMAIEKGAAPPFSLNKSERGESGRRKHSTEKMREQGKDDAEMNDTVAFAVQTGRRLSVPDEIAEPSGMNSRNGAALDPASKAKATDAAEPDGDSALADELAQLGRDSGVFEILMPEGDTLGVAVDHRQQSVMFLLSAQSQPLALSLKRRAAELQSRLERRMRTEVGLIVL